MQTSTSLTSVTNLALAGLPFSCLMHKLYACEWAPEHQALTQTAHLGSSMRCQIEWCLTGMTPGANSWNFCSILSLWPPVDILIRSWNTAPKGSPCNALQHQHLGLASKQPLQMYLVQACMKAYKSCTAAGHTCSYTITETATSSAQLRMVDVSLLSGLQNQCEALCLLTA